MFFARCLLAVTFITTTIAVPPPAIALSTSRTSGHMSKLIHKRNTSAGVSDTDLLNFGLTLEHIQDALFRQGLHNYSAFDFQNADLPSTAYSDLKEISSQTSAHVKTLTSILTTLTSPASAECTYSWPSIEGATGFILFAQTLSGLITSAWQGIIPALSAPSLLSQPLAIMLSDAGQDTYLRSTTNFTSFPSVYNTPLTPSQAWTIASTFVASCPNSSLELAVKANPQLSVSYGAPTPAKAGSDIVLSTPGGPIVGKDVTGAFLGLQSPVFFDVVDDGNGGWKGSVPDGLSGQSYVVLNEGKEGVTDGSVLAGPAIVEVGG